MAQASKKITLNNLKHFSNILSAKIINIRSSLTSTFQKKYAHKISK